MKAVYEMPRVSIEEFAADSALATNCGINHVIKFDCFLGNNVDQTSVLSTQFNIANNTGTAEKACSIQAGFADFKNVTTDPNVNDNISTSQVNLGNALSSDRTKNNSHIDWTNNDGPGAVDYANVDNTSSFLGWFYISYSGWSATSKSVNTSSHWKILNGVLTYDGAPGMQGGSILHAALAPVFSLQALTSY